MDVVFALDSSAELSTSDYNQQKDFVLTMINAFTISDTKTHVGVITVGETARKDFELREHTRPGVLKARVAGLPAKRDVQSDPTSRLSDMLRRASEVFRNGGRARVSTCVLHKIKTSFKLLKGKIKVKSSYEPSGPSSLSQILWNEATGSISTPPLDGMLIHRRVIPSI